MKVVIAHLGPIAELIAATSINKGIKKQSVKTNITWVVLDEYKYVFKFNKNVEKVFSQKEFEEQEGQYDLFINLWPAIVKSKVSVREYMGFGFYDEFKQFEGAFLNTHSFPKMSNFQLYFRLAGLIWRGEGYDIGYYPKTKTKKNRIGMSAVNANLRNYVLDNLEIDDKKIWYIPYKKNIFKKIDEINRCKKIITDDSLTLHLSLVLRKQVYYLETYPQMLKIEFFNKGQLYSVPYNYVR